MKCPKCKTPTKVFRVRTVVRANVVYRQRKCPQCKDQKQTVERWTGY